MYMTTQEQYEELLHFLGKESWTRKEVQYLRRTYFPKDHIAHDEFTYNNYKQDPEGLQQAVVLRIFTFERELKIKKEIPRHPDFDALMPYLGPSKQPVTDEEKLIELIDGEFMFDGFPGFEYGVIAVVEILKEYGFDINSKKGQKILKTFIEHAQEEYYGDFDRFALCNNCDEEFKPLYSLDYANKVLKNKIFCKKCSKK